MRHLVVAALVLIASPCAARDAGQWEATDSQVRDWFRGLMQPDDPERSCCGEADAYYADEIKVRDNKTYAVITDTRDDAPLGRPQIPVGTEIEIPNAKLKYDRGNPTGHAVVFVTWRLEVLCFVQGGGV